MIDTKQIIWSRNCVDPSSRVFFAENRVFRAFEDVRKAEVLAFLHSDCYDYLLSKGMIVRTWVAKDVQIEGYGVILEHERVHTLRPQWMPYDQLKDILLFHFEINRICKEYGYGLRDIGYDNVTLHNGKYCFVDFGSFRKIENIDNKIYLDSCLPLACLPLLLYTQNNGQDFIADKMLVDYDIWEMGASVPSHQEAFYDFARTYLTPIVDKYKLYLARYHKINISFRHPWFIPVVSQLNKIAYHIFKRQPWWHFIKIKNIYSEDKAYEVMKNIKCPYESVNSLPINADKIVLDLKDILAKFVDVKHLTLWGNFKIEDISELRKHYKGVLVVMTSDRFYANTLYRFVHEQGLDIRVLCTNAMRGKEPTLFSYLRTDMLFLQCKVYEHARVGENLNFAEKASYMSKYIVMSTLDAQETEDNKKALFWNLIDKYKDYCIFENKNE